MLGAAGEVEEQAALRVPAALEQRLLGLRRVAGPALVAGHPVQRPQRERVRDVDQHVLDVLVGGAGDRRGAPARAPAALDEPRVARLPVRERAVDGVVLGRVVEAGLVGQQDREQPVAVGVALVQQPVGVRRKRREALLDEGLVTVRDALPRERQQRRLDRLGAGVAAEAGGRVQRRAPPARRGLPEGGVRDEAVRAAGPQQRAQLLLGPLAVDVAPGDRVEARVPVPLVLVAPRRGAGERERRPVAPDALAPVGAQDGLGLRRSAQVVVRDRGAVAGTSEDPLDGQHVARVIEVGWVQVEPQDAAGERGAGADQRRRRGALERAARPQAERGRRRAPGAAQGEQRRPPVEAAAQVLAQRTRVRVAGGDEPARLQPDAGEDAQAGLDGRDRRLRVEPGVLRGLPALPLADRAAEPRTAAACAGAAGRAGRRRRRRRRDRAASWPAPASGRGTGAAAARGSPAASRGRHRGRRASRASARSAGRSPARRRGSPRRARRVDPA